MHRIGGQMAGVQVVLDALQTGMNSPGWLGGERQVGVAARTEDAPASSKLAQGT